MAFRSRLQPLIGWCREHHVALTLLTLAAPVPAMALDCPIAGDVTIAGSEAVATNPCVIADGIVTVAGGGLLSQAVGGQIDLFFALDVRAGGTFDNAGAVTVHNLLLNEGSLFNRAGASIEMRESNLAVGILENRVGATLSNAGTITNGGESVNLGRFEILTGGELINDTPYGFYNGNFFAGGPVSSAELINAGRIVNSAGSLFSNTATMFSSGSVINAGHFLLNGGTLDLSGTLENAGLFTNNGTLRVSGTLSGPGSFSNISRLDVLEGGEVTLGSANELSAGVLGGGVWRVLADDGVARLEIGSGDITRIAAPTTVALNGAGAEFAQLDTLTHNAGLLSIGQRTHTLGAPFTNTGTLEVLEDGHVQINGSTNLVGGTLTGGRWLVRAGNGSASLALDSAPITTLAAGIEVLLAGAGAKFAQLDALTLNDGTLRFGAGVEHTLAASLTNNGLLDNAGQLNNDASLVNHGTLDNRGVLDNRAGAFFGNDGLYFNNGSLRNAGVVHIGGDPWINFGEIRNLAGGEIRVTASGPLFSFVHRGTVLENAGYFDLTDFLAVSDRTIRNLAGGTFIARRGIISDPAFFNSRLYSIENAGLFQYFAGLDGVTVAAIDNLAGGTFENRGFIRVHRIDNFGVIDNHGSLMFGRFAGRPEGFVVENAGSFRNRGRLAAPSVINHVGSHLQNEDVIDADVFIHRGKLTGIGDVEVADQFEVMAGAVVAPGDGIGTLNLHVENTEVFFDGILDIEIDGGTHDVLNVFGAHGLRFGDNAELHVSLLGTPALDVDFGILFTEALSGFDDTLAMSFFGLGTGLDYTLKVVDGDVYVRFHETTGTVVPVPAAGVLMFSGIAILFATRVRRRHAT